MLRTLQLSTITFHKLREIYNHKYDYIHYTYIYEAQSHFKVKRDL